MGEKVGKLIREARTGADLTQEKLAKKVGGGLTASDVSRAERGEIDLPQATLRAIAKATGVTQASLVDAAKAESASSGKKTSTGKTTSAKTTAKKTTAKSTAKKAKTPDSAGVSMRVTATEKRLVEAYRLADGDAKKAAMKLLKGECPDMAAKILGGSGADMVADLLGDALSGLLGGK
ncbi:MAG: helix-turn-helix domain-containing protein [Aristaeellaceae bacterium]